MSRIVAIVAPISRPHTCQLSLQNVSPEIYESKCIATPKLINLTFLIPKTNCLQDTHRALNDIMQTTVRIGAYRKKLDTFPFIFTTSFCLQNAQIRNAKWIFSPPKHCIAQIIACNKCQVLFYCQEYWAFFGN